MNDDHFPGKFAAARRPGVYLRIMTPGAISSGDTVEVDPAEQPAIRISFLVDDDITQEVLHHAVDDPRVPDNWRQAAARALGRA
jgi:MOSC domain-containing protein YiiM